MTRNDLSRSRICDSILYLFTQFSLPRHPSSSIFMPLISDNLPVTRHCTQPLSIFNEASGRQLFELLMDQVFQWHFRAGTSPEITCCCKTLWRCVIHPLSSVKTEPGQQINSSTSRWVLGGKVNNQFQSLYTALYKCVFVTIRDALSIFILFLFMCFILINQF